MPKCGGCKNYFPKDELRPVGIQNFCGSCSPTTLKAKAPMKRTPMKKKPAKNPMPKGLREEVLAADGNRCRFCGSREGLHVHHVVYRSSGGKHERSNLITLCFKHHDTVHSDKAKFQPLCQKIIERREGPGKDKASLIVHSLRAERQNKREQAKGS